MIDVFGELKKQSLDYESLKYLKTEYLIDDFLVGEAITMIYGKESQGKSFFLLGLMKKLEQYESIENIIFIDLDNPKNQLKKRNLDIHFGNSKKITYLTKGDLTITRDELLELLMQGTREASMYYKGTIIVIDSTRDMMESTYNDIEAKRFMQKMKDLRDSGATVLLIHHSTKSGRVIDGSADFTRSADNVFELKQKAKFDNMLHFSLKVEYDRDPIKHCGFSVQTQTLELKELDESLSQMSEYEEEFVNKAMSALKKNSNGLNKTEIIEATGHQKSDNSARDTLEKFTNKYWKCEKIKNRFVYTSVN